MTQTRDARMVDFDRQVGRVVSQLNRLAERARLLALRRPQPLFQGNRTSVHFRRKLRPWFQTYRPNGRYVVSFGLLYFAVTWSPPPWLATKFQQLRERFPWQRS